MGHHIFLLFCIIRKYIFGSFSKISVPNYALSLSPRPQISSPLSLSLSPEIFKIRWITNYFLAHHWLCPKPCAISHNVCSLVTLKYDTYMFCEWRISVALCQSMTISLDITNTKYKICTRAANGNVLVVASLYRTARFTFDSNFE